MRAPAALSRKAARPAAGDLADGFPFENFIGFFIFVRLYSALLSYG
jgi:hypothetical protein